MGQCHRICRLRPRLGDAKNKIVRDLGFDQKAVGGQRGASRVTQSTEEGNPKSFVCVVFYTILGEPPLPKADFRLKVGLCRGGLTIFSGQYQRIWRSSPMALQGSPPRQHRSPCIHYKTRWARERKVVMKTIPFMVIAVENGRVPEKYPPPQVAGMVRLVGSVGAGGEAGRPERKGAPTAQFTKNAPLSTKSFTFVFAVQPSHTCGTSIAPLSSRLPTFPQNFDPSQLILQF